MRYSIERVGDTERWARVQAKMDTLTPADGSVRFWVLSDDPRFQYGKGLDRDRAHRPGGRRRGSLVAAAGRQTLPHARRSASPPLDERPAVRLIVGVDIGAVRPHAARLRRSR